jgi:glutathione S-transferase
MRYIASTRDTADHWYPKDALKRARVDEWLDWHHLNLRQGGQSYIFNKVLGPAMGAPADQQAISAGLKGLIRSLKFIEAALSDGRVFLTGGEITIADLSLFCEIDQFRVDPSLQLDVRFPGVIAWTDRVRKATSPHYEKISTILEKAVKKFGSAHSKL